MAPKLLLIFKLVQNKMIVRRLAGGLKDV